MKDHRRRRLADVRDTTRLEARTVRGLPPGASPADYVLGRLRAASALVEGHLRDMPLDLLATGQGEGPG